MRFVFAMAWRETRSSWRRLGLFFACMALAVGAMVSLRSFTRVFSTSVVRDARVLLGADVRVESRDPWTAEQREIFAHHATSALAAGSTNAVETITMVRADGTTAARPLLAAVRGVDPGFPLRGTLRLSGTAPYADALLAERGIVVSLSLLERLQLHIGDRVLIGGVPFTIHDTILRLPGNSLNFTPIPRVVMRLNDLMTLPLTGFGSQVTYTWMFNAVDGEERALARAIANDYQRDGIRGWVATYHYTENWLITGLANIDGALSLIGLSIVILGGIGIASVTRVFVQQRVHTIAILKCLGGRTRIVLGAYFVQVFMLSAAGGLTGLLVAQALTSGLADAASRRLPLDVEPRLSAQAAIEGVLICVLVSLLFALSPLLDVRSVKPILVLRHESPPRRRFDFLKASAQLVIASAIAGLAVWQGGNRRDAAIFLAAVVGTTIVLQGAAGVLMTMLARVRNMGTFAVRQGIRSLYRPGNQTRVTLFTVGLGAVFVIAVCLFQVNVQQEYSLDLDRLFADMFFIDVSPGEQDGVVAMLQGSGAREVVLVPMAQGRLIEIRRSPTNPAPVARERLGGEYRLTSRAVLDPSERLAEGPLWPTIAASQPEVSVDDEYAGWLDVKLGDALIFDVGGRRVEALVTSVRRETRRIRSFASLVRSNFILRPGVLETLPHTLVGAAKGPPDAQSRARLQNDFVAAFPSVTFADAIDEIQDVRRRVNDVSLAVSALGGFVVACGVLILVGSVAITRLHRLYEAAVFRTLGARTRVLVRITFVEYGVLGLLAGVIGSLASIAVTWGLSRFGARPIPWHLHPWINVLGAITTTLLVVIVGVVASIRVFAQKPMSALRDP